MTILRMRRMICLTEISNSLRELDRPADRIRQHRQASDEPILIVEGESDFLVLRPLLPEVEIFPADGKNNVVDTARTLISWNIDKFVCITDDDFDDGALISDLDHVHHPYCGTDMEAMLISLGVLASMLEHIGSTVKLTKLGGASKLVDDLIAHVAPVTALREVSSRRAWGLPFDEVPIASKIHKTTLVLNIESYCDALRRQMDEPIEYQVLVKTARDHSYSASAFRGKDVVAAAGVALRKTAGNLPHAAADPDCLCAQLHSSSAFALSKSEWYEELRGRLEVAGSTTHHPRG